MRRKRVEFFPASLGTREKLVTYAVGYGVGIGVPLILGIGFSLGFRQPIFLLLPVPFILAVGTLSLFQPIGIAVTLGEIVLLRRVGTKTIPIHRLKTVTYPASQPTGVTIGLLSVQGIYGAHGTFWNRGWGRFRLFVTDHRKQVELICVGGSRIIVSPDDPTAFVVTVKKHLL